MVQKQDTVVEPADYVGPSRSVLQLPDELRSTWVECYYTQLMDNGFTDGAAKQAAWRTVRSHSKGGAGSGHWGHAGRPGEEGGSAPGDGEGGGSGGNGVVGRVTRVSNRLISSARDAGGRFVQTSREEWQQMPADKKLMFLANVGVVGTMAATAVYRAILSRTPAREYPYVPFKGDTEGHKQSVLWVEEGVMSFAKAAADIVESHLGRNNFDTIALVSLTGTLETFKATTKPGYLDFPKNDLIISHGIDGVLVRGTPARYRDGSMHYAMPPNPKDIETAARLRVGELRVVTPHETYVIRRSLHDKSGKGRWGHAGSLMNKYVTDSYTRRLQVIGKAHPELPKHEIQRQALHQAWISAAKVYDFHYERIPASERPRKVSKEATRLLTVAYKGGPGSGNFGHAGRPGEEGGSAPSDGATGDSVVRTIQHNLDVAGRGLTGLRVALNSNRGLRATVQLSATAAVLGLVALTYKNDIAAAAQIARDTVQLTKLAQQMAHEGGEDLTFHIGAAAIRGGPHESGSIPLSWSGPSPSFQDLQATDRFTNLWGSVVQNDIRIEATAAVPIVITDTNGQTQAMLILRRDGPRENSSYVAALAVSPMQQRWMLTTLHVLANAQDKEIDFYTPLPPVRKMCDIIGLEAFKPEGSSNTWYGIKPLPKDADAFEGVTVEHTPPRAIVPVTRKESASAGAQLIDLLCPEIQGPCIWVLPEDTREQPTKARKIITVVKGGPGSGNFGHAGRPGEEGGSAPGDGGSAAVGSPRSIADLRAAGLRYATRDTPAFANQLSVDMARGLGSTWFLDPYMHISNFEALKPETALAIGLTGLSMVGLMHEELYVFDGAGNTLLHERASDDNPYSVHIADSDLPSLQGSILVHNHQETTYEDDSVSRDLAFSLEDVFIAINNDVDQTRVITPKATYILYPMNPKGEPGAKWPSAEAVAKLLEPELARGMMISTFSVLSGRRSRAQADEKLSDDLVHKLNNSNLGLRCYRVDNDAIKDLYYKLEHPDLQPGMGMRVQHEQTTARLRLGGKNRRITVGVA
jgi:hypothetical protein